MHITLNVKYSITCFCKQNTKNKKQKSKTKSTCKIELAEKHKARQYHYRIVQLEKRIIQETNQCQHAQNKSVESQ